jgi:hypothetical protein
LSNTLKYYVYISDAKVDMLYPQIPKGRLRRLASELSINLKLLAAEISTTVKNDQSQETRYSKLRLIVKYIEKEAHVGTVDHPGTYFKGTLFMHWGRLENSDTVYFTGTSVDLSNPRSPFSTTLGLGGSLRHVIGNTDTLPTQHAPEFNSPSAAPVLLGALINEIQLASSPNQQIPSPRDPSSILYAVSGMVGHMKGPPQRFEFLARTLLQEDYPVRRILLGTPIYVALAD